MEKQILEELYGKLRELIPDFETREEGNKNYISYKMQINDKDFETSVVITNGRAVAITGKRTYIYQIKEKSCEQFNNEVQTRYPLFQIYGGNGNISVGRRLLFDSVDELVTNIREFNSVCKAVIPQFEGSCVNFLVKTREEETYDPTQTFTPLEEESSNEKNADYVDSFVKDQQEYCKKTFYELAEGAEPVTKGNDVSFIRNEGDGSLKVTMDKNAPEDLKLDYAYVVDDQELAYIAIANITSTYKELEAFYNEKKRMLHVYSYVTPDKYLPDEPKEGIGLLKEAINNSLETAKKSTVSGEQVSANMQALMNEQLEEIRLKTEELESSRTQIEEERGAFEKEKEAFLNEKNQMEAELEEERTKLQEKEAELEERENAIAEQESINDEEKAKYALSMKNLTGEIARLQARLGQGSAAKEDSGEVAKLKSRLNSVTKARASMEKTLNNENNELRRKNKELSDLLLEKTQETDNYDCSKSSLTTFVLPWIRHVVTEYCSRNFHKTTSYYADGIRKVSAAMNYCQEKNIPSSIETLQKLTGLRIPTIKKCIDLLSKKDVVSYEVLSENGFEQSSSLSSPENIFIKNEETESFNHILEESLTEEELEIMILLLQPDNPAKLKASYREIAQKTHTNVPYVKDCISRATMKLKNNKELLRKYPNVIKMYDESMVGESAPVLDDGDLIKEQYEELSED